MSSHREVCSICQRASNSFNYGATSCNSCKIFFRRVLFAKPIKCCLNSDKCHPNSCRMCRLKKCIEAGMTIRMTMIQSDQDSLAKLMSHLKVLDVQRIRQIQHFRYDGDPTVEELVKISSPIHFLPKSENYEMDNIEWGNLVALTTIDYMKKFNFLNLLDLKDRVLLVQSSFSDFDMFSNAARAFESKKEETSYPDGSTIFLKMKCEIDKELEKNISCRLVGRLSELKITPEEFLLLTSIFFCNPAITNLSRSGKITLSFYQNIYTSCLLQYCFINYQQNGATRFTELLSLYSSIKRAHEDIGFHYFLCKTKSPDLPFRRLFAHEMLS